jgi:hypothetical protein
MLNVGHGNFWEKRKRHEGFWWINLKKMNYLIGLGVCEKVILKWILKEEGVERIRMDQNKETLTKRII